MSKQQHDNKSNLKSQGCKAYLAQGSEDKRKICLRVSTKPCRISKRSYTNTNSHTAQQQSIIFVFMAHSINIALNNLTKVRQYFAVTLLK